MLKIIIAITIFINLNLLANEDFEQKCNDGKMQYCIELGILYYNANGVKKDLKKSQNLFKKACKNRVSRGCYYLGFGFLRGGKGIQKSEKKAMLAFARGCNIGSERSCVEYHKLKAKGH